jgi:molecular chaperone GrpE
VGATAAGGTSAGASAGGGSESGDGGGSAGSGADATELAALRTQLEERTADLQRVNAEYANYRRRVDRDRQIVTTTAKAQVVGELLTVLDDFDRAAAHGDLTGAFKAVADRLTGALTKVGLSAFGAEGDPFDPAVHEAVQHDTSASVSGPTVSAVLRRGYRIGERVLRPAMVAVTDYEAGAGLDPAAGESESADPSGADGDSESNGAPPASGTAEQQAAWTTPEAVRSSGD